MNSLRDDLLDLPAPEGARWIARHRLAAALVACDRLADAGDADALHDFRVGVRRLRSCLRAYAPVLDDTVPKKRRRRLRDIAAATGSARDAEVHLAWLASQRGALTARERAGADWFARRLDARREAHGHEAFVEAAESFRALARSLEEELARYTVTRRLDASHDVPSCGRYTGTLLHAAADELRDALDAVRSAEDVAAAHQARIAGKRLRYLLEPVVDVLGDGRALVQTLEEVQERLGDLHDAHVFAAELLEAARDADAEEKHGARVTERAEKRARAAAEPGQPAPPSARGRTRRVDPRGGLLALADRVNARGAAAYRDAERTYLGGRAAALLDEVHGLADRLMAGDGDGVEIERKFLLRALPDAVVGAPVAELEQGYLPGRRLVERVRRVRDADGERWFRTVKAGRGVRRLELEEETTRDVFDALWALTEGRRVRKRRYRVPDGGVVGRTWEVDEFTDRELVLAEVELDSASAEVALPEWLAPHVVRDVTGEHEYGNRTLAR